MQEQQKKNRKLTLLIIRCTSSNTIIHANWQKNKNIVVSAGYAGFLGSNRSTTHAAQKTGECIGKKLTKIKQKDIVAVFRDSSDKEHRNKRAVIKGLKKFKINIRKVIVDAKIAHNGCRLKKKKR
jgi:ribosomal protein S11